MGGISLVHIKSVEVFSEDYEMEGVECEVVLKAELSATSELKIHSEAVCVEDSFHNSSVPAQGLCCSVAALKSKSLKYSFSGGAGR